MLDVCIKMNGGPDLIARLKDPAATRIKVATACDETEPYGRSIRVFHRWPEENGEPLFLPYSPEFPALWAQPWGPTWRYLTPEEIAESGQQWAAIYPAEIEPVRYRDLVIPTTATSHRS